MQFVRLPRGTRVPSGSQVPALPGFAYLIEDRWNDFGYVTQFYLVLIDHDGSPHDIGNVRIGGFGVPVDWDAAPSLPDRFERLDAAFFSLAREATYYERLQQLGPDVRVEVLTALNDLAYKPALLERARHEDVTLTSLLRDLPLEVVKAQFHRAAIGGDRIAEYVFDYKPASFFNSADSRLWTQPLRFAVVPNRLPPTNIHVIIGRNSAGKSHLLRGLTRAVADSAAVESEVGRIIERDPGPMVTFSGGVVAVSFSAFDAFVDIPEQSQVLPYRRIGVHQPHDGEEATPSTRDQLAQRFAASLDACLVGEAADRWLRAVKTLRYPGSGFLEDEAWVENFLAVTFEDRQRLATSMFSRLSSGHAIVLLIMTSLVELVHERTLVVLDEPEAHLHPPLLAAFITALSELLLDRNGVAIVATHSPVVLQEVPSDCVWVIHATGVVSDPRRPTMETFGENVGVLTHEVFSLEVTHSGYHRVIREAVDAGLSYEAILELFKDRLGLEARGIARALVAIRDSAGGV
ncbi:AAA family ATPase [Actinoplanes teichomyceticus]|uniref:Putative AbiEii toxin of type IV toxin-antitoxin system n=1 Tax=Actinoplanes teichomyceticus TaxID=1867 RepID=A0A561VGG2_ACTTI|nr:AAA family ATPase [Actinoplanes teichomyceticus]TWG10716.1 putative AbiEii toxin of type IV toxin-antitoxin system [Actinoplanes teichomyceticus]GIF15482.1 hypothetical protein Ate01nite_55140 [Actinoplanes teichomyceticus]